MCGNVSSHLAAPIAGSSHASGVSHDCFGIRRTCGMGASKATKGRRLPFELQPWSRLCSGSGLSLAEARLQGSARSGRPLFGAEFTREQSFVLCEKERSTTGVEMRPLGGADATAFFVPRRLVTAA